MFFHSNKNLKGFGKYKNKISFLQINIQKDLFVITKNTTKRPNFYRSPNKTDATRANIFFNNQFNTAPKQTAQTTEKK